MEDQTMLALQRYLKKTSQFHLKIFPDFQLDLFQYGVTVSYL